MNVFHGPHDESHEHFIDGKNLCLDGHILAFDVKVKLDWGKWKVRRK